MTRTFCACGPFCPSPSSNSTFAPSASVRKPSPWIAEKWTKASDPPSSGVMKPKPFSSLNHFTTPVAICAAPPLLSYARGVLPALAFPHAYGRRVAALTARFIPVGCAATQPTSLIPVHLPPVPFPPPPASGVPWGGDSYLLGSNWAPPFCAAPFWVAPWSGVGVGVAAPVSPVSFLASGASREYLP